MKLLITAYSPDDFAARYHVRTQWSSPVHYWVGKREDAAPIDKCLADRLLDVNRSLTLDGWRYEVSEWKSS